MPVELFFGNDCGPAPPPNFTQMTSPYRNSGLPRPIPRPSGGKAPSPPRYLNSPERKLWRELHAGFDLTDPAAVALLIAAMEAHQRSRKCRESVDHDGQTFRDRFGQVRPHPLLAAERDARAAFLAAMRALNLDVTTTGGSSR